MAPAETGVLLYLEEVNHIVKVLRGERLHTNHPNVRLGNSKLEIPVHSTEVGGKALILHFQGGETFST